MLKKITAKTGAEYVNDSCSVLSMPESYGLTSRAGLGINRTNVINSNVFFRHDNMHKKYFQSNINVDDS